MSDAIQLGMKISPKLLITLATAAAFSLATFLLFEFFGGESETTRYLDDISVNPSGVGVPDGGSTVSLLGCALLGLAALRRKLSC
jgi:hypothetical protein